MKPYAVYMDLYDALTKKYRVGRKGENFYPSDQTRRGLNTYMKESLKDQGDKIRVNEGERFNQLSGILEKEAPDLGAKANISRQLEGARLQQLADQDATRGSRMTNLGALTLLGLGTSVAGMPGGAIGASMGGLAGSYLDRYGRELIANRLARKGPQIQSMDEKLKAILNVVSPKYREALMNALSRGMQAFIVTHYMLSTRDPEYRAETEGIDFEP